MRAKEFLKLIEAAKKTSLVPGDPKSDPLYNLKLVIANKIKDLPPTPETKNSLEEIEDVLSHIQVSRRQAATTDFGAWTDEDVKKAKELLAKYIVGLDAPVSYKKSMLEHWKSGGLINVDILLDGTHTINEIVKDYDSNPAIKELTDDLMQVAGLGKGKGEFMLKVLSPQITDPGGKGDILVKGVGTIEVKTTDGGAGRFYDRQVRPGSGYQSAVNDFIKTFGQYAEEPTQPVDQDTTTDAPMPQAPVSNVPSAPSLNTQPTVEAKSKKAAEPKPKKISSSTGINIDGLISLYQKIPAELKVNFGEKLTIALEQIFLKAPEYVGAVIQAIKEGPKSAGKAKQLYGVGILNNYMAFKTDKGILYIDLTISTPTFTFFTDNASLNAGGLRLHVGTVYPIANDGQYAYPQTSIVKTGQTQPGI